MPQASHGPRGTGQRNLPTRSADASRTWPAHPALSALRHPASYGRPVPHVLLSHPAPYGRPRPERPGSLSLLSSHIGWTQK